MMLRRKLSNRLFSDHGLPSPTQVGRNIPIRSSSLCCENLRQLDTDGRTLFRRFLQQRALIQSASKAPELLSLPTGEKHRVKLSGLHITTDHLPIGGFSPPVTEKLIAGRSSGISVEEARRILRIFQMETLQLKLRIIQESSIPYSEFVRLCFELCENEDQGNEFAKVLDESGSVIVLGNVVFLRPEQVARSVGTMIAESAATSNDPRITELVEMEQQKAIIDQKAQAQVQTELNCGLGLLLGQTIGLMRLTFWDLSWDVMEPICFFVTSLHFFMGFGFFLKTGTEPSFEGYFRRRFRMKQAKLMQIYNFDINKYNELRQVCNSIKVKI